MPSVYCQGLPKTPDTGHNHPQRNIAHPTQDERKPGRIEHTVEWRISPQRRLEKATDLQKPLKYRVVEDWWRTPNMLIDMNVKETRHYLEDERRNEEGNRQRAANHHIAWFHGLGREQPIKSRTASDAVTGCI